MFKLIISLKCININIFINNMNYLIWRKIPIDIWRELKTYLIHNIKTQGKHLKKNKNIINFNNVLFDLPRFKPPRNGPWIIYNSNEKPFKITKYLYHIQAFKPRHQLIDGKITIIVYGKRISNVNGDYASERDEYNDYYLSHRMD